MPDSRIFKGDDRGGIILIILQVLYWQQLHVVFYADGGLRLSGASRTANARPDVYGCTILTHDTSHILAISRICTIKITLMDSGGSTRIYRKTSRY